MQVAAPVTCCKMRSCHRRPKRIQRSVRILQVMDAKISTGHEAAEVGLNGLPPPPCTGSLWAVAPPPCLAQRRFDDLCKGVTRTIQARLDRTKIAFGDFGDLFVRPALQFTKHEHIPMVCRQLRN